MSTANSPSPNATLEAALQLAEDGFRVLILKPATKRPFTTEDHPPAGLPRRGLKDATCDPDTIRRWFDRCPDGNLGIATGAESGIFVIDVDSRHGGDESLRALEDANGELPETLMVMSGRGDGGRHLYFRHPGFQVRNSVAKLSPGLDIKGDGGYVVAPPSIHPDSGQPYSVDCAETDDESMTRIRREEIAEASSWLLDLIRESAPAAKPHSRAKEDGSDSHDGNGTFPEGERNDRLFRHACKLRRIGSSEAEIEAAILQVNQNRCTPPLDETEVKGIARNSARYEPVESVGENGSTHGAGTTPKALAGRTEPYADPSGNESSVNTVNFVTGVDWEKPLPFTVDLSGLPDFPVEALPPVLREMVVGTAEQVQVPPEMAACGVLASTAAVIAGVTVVEPWVGYREVTNCWFAPTAPPGSRKSAAIRQACGPIEQIERELADEAEPKIRAQAAKKKLAKKIADEALKVAAQSPGKPDLAQKAERLAVEHDGIQLIAEPRLITCNATPEALNRLLAENDGRMFVATAEGGEVIAIAAGLYTKGQDHFDVLLKGWSGDSIVIDRRGADPIRVESPAISQLVMFQPVVLREMGAHKSFRDRGFLARYCFCICRNNVGSRKARGQAIDDRVRQQYADMLSNLARIPVVRECRPNDDPGDPTGPIIPYVLHFDASAAARFEVFCEELEAAQAPGAELESLRDWASKAHGQCLRIAAALHLAQHCARARPWELPICTETIAAAECITRFFLEHAKVAFQLMGEDPTIAGALRILRWLREKSIEQTTKRDLHRALQGSFTRAADLDDPLAVLEERNYIRIVLPQSEPGKPGRPPSSTLIVTPYLADSIDTNDRTAAEVGSVSSVDSVNGEGPRENGRRPSEDESADEGVIRF